MYRDDQEALHQRLEGTTREADRLRQENESMRAAVGRMQLVPSASVFTLPPTALYKYVDIRTIPLEERARLAMHTVTPFPVWATGLLTILTLGLFPLIYFGLQHDRLPKSSVNDPSAGKAIGFQFIPYYNLYWMFFNSLRLCDRLTLQFRLRGTSETAPRGLVLASCILSVIPYLNILAILLLWPITNCMLQSTINRVARLSQAQWDATVLQIPPPPGYLPSGIAPGPGY